MSKQKHSAYYTIYQGMYKGCEIMYIVTGSVTSAMRLARAVEREGEYFADVVHTPAALSPVGCSYSVKLKDEAYESAKRIAEEIGIKIKKAYKEKIKDGERVFYDISG